MSYDSSQVGPWYARAGEALRRTGLAAEPVLDKWAGASHLMIGKVPSFVTVHASIDKAVEITKQIMQLRGGGNHDVSKIYAALQSFNEAVKSAEDSDST